MSFVAIPPAYSHARARGCRTEPACVVGGDRAKLVEGERRFGGPDAVRDGTLGHGVSFAAMRAKADSAARSCACTFASNQYLWDTRDAGGVGGKGDDGE